MLCRLQGRGLESWLIFFHEVGTEEFWGLFVWVFFSKVAMFLVFREEDCSLPVISAVYLCHINENCCKLEKHEAGHLAIWMKPVIHWKRKRYEIIWGSWVFFSFFLFYFPKDQMIIPSLKLRATTLDSRSCNWYKCWVREKRCLYLKFKNTGYYVIERTFPLRTWQFQ